MPIWREDEDSRCISLIITRAGRDAIGVEDDAGEPDLQASSKSSGLKPARQQSGTAPRPNSKQALVVEMLSKDKGATLDALVEATGCLPHTTRAALTGLCKRGFLVERARHETKGSLYRIVSDQKASARA